MKRKIVRAKIFRYNPRVDREPYFDTYEVPYQSGMSAHSLIQYIYSNLDNTLAFRNYYCCQGVCKTCLVQINGKNMKACTSRIKAGDEMKIEPAKGFQLIRDLAVDLSKKG